MPSFALRERDPEWVAHAPVRITNTFNLAASPTQVFDRLADLAAWSEWFKGMRKVRIDGSSSGVGALRTVWVGLTRVQERFVVWDPGHRLVFTLTRSNTPGLHSVVEDWAIAPDPTDPSASLLTVSVGIQGALLLRPFPFLIRIGVSSALKGAADITTQFG